MYIQLILKTNKVKNIKDTAPFILISWAWVKTVPVPSTVGQCSIADGHVLASGSCTSGSVAILLIINRCLLLGPKILKSEKSLSSSARTVLVRRKKHLSSPIHGVRWEMFS